MVAKNDWNYNEQAVNLGEIPMDLYHGHKPALFLMKTNTGVSQFMTILSEKRLW